MSLCSILSVSNRSLHRPWGSIEYSKLMISSFRSILFLYGRTRLSVARPRTGKHRRFYRIYLRFHLLVVRSLRILDVFAIANRLVYALSFSRNHICSVREHLSKRRYLYVRNRFECVSGRSPSVVESLPFFLENEIR